MANAATWKRRVAAWRESGETAAEYARGRGFAPTTLTWWASRLGRPGVEDAAVKIPIVRVVRQPSEASKGRAAGVTLEVSGARVVVDIGFDEGTLASVLALLDGRGARR